jgi:hypothetical protein
LVKWALSEVGEVRPALVGKRIGQSIRAVDVLLSECARTQLEDKENAAKTAMDRLNEMSPCDLQALEAVLTAEVRDIAAVGGAVGR